jgi:uncharacterized repeat protein (TIGR01451 family)
MKSRVRIISVAVAALATAVTAAPAGAQAPPPATKSANVTALTTLPEPNGISANFHGNLMYLSSSRGLSIYDIKNPEAPQRLSFFPLPNFENEDVDTNGEILLISNDPSEGKGVLWIFDVRDPRNPQILSQLDTGLIDTFGLLPYGTGHTATCIQNCRYVYLAGTGRGIDIADLTDPAKPKLVGTFGAPEATGLTSHDVQVDSDGLAWVVGYNGTAAYDTTNPLAPRLVYHTDDSGKSRYADDLANDGKSLNDFIHHNSMRLNNGSLASPPAGSDPAAESDVVAVTEEDYTRPTCEGAGQLETWKIGPDGILRNLDSFVVEVDPSRTTLCSAHYFDERGGLIAQGWYEAGTRFLDVTNPADIKQVGYWIPARNVTWSAYYAPTDPKGEIVYSIDTTRGVDVIKIDRSRPDTSTPPPGGGSGSPQGQPGAGGEGGAGAGGSGSAPAPNVSLKLTDRRNSVRAGQQREYALTVHNAGPGTAKGIAVTVDLPKGVARVRGGSKAARGRQVVYTIDRLAAGKGKRLKLVVKVSRRYRGRRLDMTAAATTDGDVDPRNNFSVDRNRVRSARKGKSRSARPAGPETMAARTSRMPAVIAPKLGPAETKAYAYSFGRLCRIALD